MPAWGVRTIVEALISFMPTPGNGAIGALDWTEEERKRLADLSHSFDAKLPDDYLAHLKIWREKFPSLSKDDDSLKINKDTTEKFHFHDSKSSSSNREEMKKETVSKGKEIKEEEEEEEKKEEDTKEAPMELRRRQRNREQQQLSAPKTRRSLQRRPNHCVEFIGFFFIAVLVASVLYAGRRYLRL